MDCFLRGGRAYGGRIIIAERPSGCPEQACFSVDNIIGAERRCCFLSLRMGTARAYVRTGGSTGEPSHIYDVPGMEWKTWARSATAPDRAVRARRASAAVIRGIHPTPLVTDQTRRFSEGGALRDIAYAGPIIHRLGLSLRSHHNYVLSRSRAPLDIRRAGRQAKAPLAVQPRDRHGCLVQLVTCRRRARDVPCRRVDRAPIGDGPRTRVRSASRMRGALDDLSVTSRYSAEIASSPRLNSLPILRSRARVVRRPILSPISRFVALEFYPLWSRDQRPAGYRIPVPISRPSARSVFVLCGDGGGSADDSADRLSFNSGALVAHPGYQAPRVHYGDVAY
ncbi:hypothetical protein EVAR_54896_1 [Eumeta japonica]|uniref:Uncharacterized protein n=1 Tax=Eumeta variegata TaxID=151549 RepID=A0A4C2A1U4_EUMVA|nr:hypothetical protein EVAR_54896_1 [Eumeta japonica]